jgi:putative DNA primase/helicase
MLADTEEKINNAGAKSEELGAKDRVEAEIKELAALGEIEYGLERKRAAKRLGITTALLDRLVRAEHGDTEGNTGQGRAILLFEPEPWFETVDGAELLTSISAAIRCHVVLSEDVANAIALWVVHCYAYQVFTCTPRLAITSPEKQCGKTTLLDVLECLVPRPLMASNITASAVFRTVEIAIPTILIDEADTFLDTNEELLGILNSGHRRGGQVVRVVGDNHEPRQFSTHSPAAIALIGKLPPTLADRSIAVTLRRRLPDEACQAIPFAQDRQLETASAKIGTMGKRQDRISTRD